MIDVSSKYKDALLELKRKIREKEIFSLEKKADNNACYFCSKGIEGKMKVLIDFETINGHEVETEYYLDFSCYRRELN